MKLSQPNLMISNMIYSNMVSHIYRIKELYIIPPFSCSTIINSLCLHIFLIAFFLIALLLIAERFDAMKACKNHYFVTVIEDITAKKIIASSTLSVELKFIRCCALVKF